MNKNKWFNKYKTIDIVLIIFVVILIFDKFMPIIPNYQFGEKKNVIVSIERFLPVITFVITFLAILFTGFSISNIYTRYESIKEISKFKKKINNEIKEYKKKIDDTKKDVLFLKNTSNTSMNALSILFIEYITRYENINNKSKLSDEMRNTLAVSIVNILKLLITVVSAVDVNSYLYKLTTIPDRHILSNLNDIKDELLKRCERDSEFIKEALENIPDADSSHPFKDQIDDLTQIINDALQASDCCPK